MVGWRFARWESLWRSARFRRVSMRCPRRRMQSPPPHQVPSTAARQHPRAALPCQAWHTAMQVAPRRRWRVCRAWTCRRRLDRPLTRWMDMPRRALPPRVRRHPRAARSCQARCTEMPVRRCRQWTICRAWICRRLLDRQRVRRLSMLRRRPRAVPPCRVWRTEMPAMPCRRWTIWQAWTCRRLLSQGRVSQLAPMTPWIIISMPPALRRPTRLRTRLSQLPSFRPTITWRQPRRSR